MNIPPRVKQIIADELQVEASMVYASSRLAEDLGAEDLDIVELILRIEEELKIGIPDNDALKLFTVGDIVRYLEEKIGSDVLRDRKRRPISKASDKSLGNPHVQEMSDIQEELEKSGEFSPSDIGDGRERILSSIIRRSGQAKFRQSLLEIYNHRCAITGCDAIDALEAAHIIPFRGENTNHLTNGLLLRADIHTLFDLHLISVDTESMTIKLSPLLQNTTYRNLHCKPLTLPKHAALHPSKAALDEHRKQAEYLNQLE